MADSGDSPQRRRDRRRLLAGIVLGIALVFVGQGGRRGDAARGLVRGASADVRHVHTGAADVIVAMGAGITGFCTPNYSGLRSAARRRTLQARSGAHRGLHGGHAGGFTCTIAERWRRWPNVSACAANTSVRRRHSNHLGERPEQRRPLRVLGARRILLVTQPTALPKPVSAASAIRSNERESRFRWDTRAIRTCSSRDSRYAAWAYYWMRGYVSDTPAPLRWSSRSSR